VVHLSNDDVVDVAVWVASSTRDLDETADRLRALLPRR